MKKELKIEDLLPPVAFFYAAFQVIHRSALRQVINIPQIREIIMIIIVILSFYIIIHFRFTKKMMIIFLFLSISFSINVVVSSTIILLVNLFFIFALARESERIKDVIYSLLLGLIISTTLILILTLIGWVPNHFRVENGRPRYYLGFNAPPALPDIYVGILTCYLVLNKDKLKTSHLFLLLIPSYVIMEFADGRSSFGVSIFIIFSITLIKKFISNKKKISNFLYNTGCSILTIGVFLSIYVSMRFPYSAFIQRQNRFFTGRLGWFSRAWRENPLRLFGNNLEENAANMIMLDNLYLQLLLRGGIIIFIISIICLFKLLKHYKKSNDYLSLIILIAIIINSLVSASWMPIWKNVLLFSLSEIIGLSIVKKNPTMANQINLRLEERKFKRNKY